MIPSLLKSLLFDSVPAFMDEDGEKRHRFRKRSRSELDWISSLPDCLLCQILSNLPTKEAVKTSILSTRWRNLWKHVPCLDLANFDFSLYDPYHPKFVPFVDSFLDLNSCLHEFKLKYDSDGEIDHLSRWINALVKRKVKHMDVTDESDVSLDFPIIPTTLYTCESLLSLKLSGLTLPNPIPNLVSLPCLKTIYLTIAKFADELALERLIPQCPVLESLVIDRSFCDDVEVLRVRSRSLLRFTHLSDSSADLDEEELVVEIDAPRLEYLKVGDHRVASFVLKDVASLGEADIDTVFNLICDKSFDPDDLQKKNMIRGFLVGISTVKDMIIASSTLEVIYDYSRCEPLPLFSNMTFLRVELYGYRWEMLPVFLESCPNLKSLVVGSIRGREKEGVNILFQPQCFLSSLEYVKIERPLEGEALEMKLVSYLLGNSRILKKLTLFLDVSIKAEESAVLKELLTIPRLSSSCQVVVL